MLEWALRIERRPHSGELSLVCHNCGQQHWLAVYADVVGDLGRDQIGVSIGKQRSISARRFGRRDFVLAL